MIEKTSVATMNIDIDRGRIRINKNVLDALGNPPFIQFLINTEKCKFAIRGVYKELPNSQTIKITPREKMRSKHYEFCSLTLINKLLEALHVKDRTGSYQMIGKNIFDDGILVFPFDTLKRIS